MSDFLKIISTLSPEQRLLFERRLKERGISLPQSSTIPKRPEKEDIPLSFAQQRLWFIQQLEPTSCVYNVPSVLRLTGDLQVQALEKSLNELRRRHETLRTCFTTNAEKQPIQIIVPWETIALELIDLTKTPNSELEVEKLALEEASHPFDLSQPLMRSRLLKISDREHILLLTTHHIISDRWSVGVFLRELSLLYSAFVQGKLSPLLELQIQYADWSWWQKQQLQGDFLAEQIDYWQQQLSGELPILQLSTHRSATSTYKGSQYPLGLSLSLSQGVKALAAKQGVTLFMLLLASFQVLLYRYTQEDDLLVGTDIVNRDYKETENLIGLLVNTLVLRTNLSGNPTVQELLQRVREVSIGAFSHQHLPFEKLVEVLNPDRNINQMMPLFQVKFDLQLASVQSPQLPGLTLERLPFDNDTAKYELRLNLQDTEQGITGQFEYCTDLFNVSTIARMAEHWVNLLEDMIINPNKKISELLLLTEEQQLLTNWNRQTTKEYPNHECLHQLFETQVEKTPNNTALIFGEESFTYQELNIKANQVAHYLQTLGVTPETPVGICVERSLEMVIGILGILKAGGVYVPLDPTYPESRLKLILEDAQVPILLTYLPSSSHKEIGEFRQTTIINLEQDWEIITQQPTNNPTTNIAPSNLAYLIYTSGSTGKPKGVMIEHRSPVCLLYWAKDIFSDNDISGVLASTSICFDLSVFEIFVPLSWGGKVILAENALELPNLPAKNQVTLINTVPSAIAQLLQFNAIPNSVQTINLAGEPLTWRLVQQMEKLPHVQKIFNLYGPSEDTTYSTYIQLKGATPTTPSPTIGRPTANTQVYVLDEHLQPVPIGVPGELYISGNGVARGYWKRPDLTAERFIDKLYKTGDRVCFLRDGNLEYLGRLDNQVKIRGYRIELGEIEALLSQHPDIEECVVVVSEADNNDKRLVAYISPASLTSTNIRQFLVERLPGYMIPSYFILLPGLPRNPNGKIDRKALPAVGKERLADTIAYVEPRTPIEQSLATIWQETLQVEQVGINDNFFALGGHSLLGIQLMAKINEFLNIEIPLKNLFQYPTIAELSAQIQYDDPSLIRGLGSQIELRPEERNQPFPLTDIQQAYLIGRNAAFELGNVATHGYQEVETVGLSVEQMERALQRLIERHDMLRVIVQPDGQQRILAEVPPYNIAVTDLRGKSPEIRETSLKSLRNQLSHQIIPTDRYPLFEIQAVLLDEGKIRFCMSFDILIGDAWSFRLLGREFVQILQNPDLELPPITLSFRDYVLAEKQLRESEIYERSQAYWQTRINTLPSAPDLPLTQPLSTITEPHFVRRSNTLASQKWQQLKQQASKAGITPSGLLLAAFAKIIGRWSKQPHFTLNLTLFNRLPLHPEVNRIVGDFTASLLLEINNQGQKNFLELARHIQSQLWEDLDNRYVSGVEVLRQLARNQQRVAGALMPVVFTSTLTQDNGEEKTERNWHGELVYSLSQTSQVYFDHQVGEVEGALVFNWDTIDDLFPPGMLNEMFQTYSNFLEQLTEEQLSYSPPLPLPPSPIPHSPLLHTLFFDQVAKQSENPAIITPEQAFTYQQVSDRVCNLAQYLQQHLPELGVTSNQLVAVVMDKGWEQVVATLAILTVGAAYVPIDPQLPTQRRLHLLQETQVQIILTQSWLDTSLEWGDNFTRVCVDTLSFSSNTDIPNPIQQPTDLAYIIYTSGSTGTPKGVMIDHRGAVNTILDINQRFNVTAKDRVLGLSSLNFDLSVYDIFGTLAAGGTIVIPSRDNSKDPNHWMQLINQYQVTIWNSVPALMELLLTSSLSSQTPSSETLRLILLSGDWIPLALPELIRSQFKQSQIISLGGATEASIWSIFYTIEEINPTWKSIPYGYSLTNQQVYVLNQNLEPCPTWVIGEIYIGGLGVAKGYWQQPELTSQKFIPIPNSQFPIYKTGDLGRYLPDGTIEFLGREDFQVKINGYRIELGEIEAALQQHPAISQAVVTTTGDTTSQQLLAYVVISETIAEQQNNFNPASQLDFKLKQHGVRSIESGTRRVNLPATEFRSYDVRRQSYRQFLQQPVSLNDLGEFLSCMRSHQLENSPLPKYRYASAGSLYPVQAYVYIKPYRVQDFESGIYYYHPQEHQLLCVSNLNEINSEIYGLNQSIFEQSAFAVFLIGDLDAIEPIYGDKARDFCLLEAGYISQLLMETAPNHDLGLCPIGALEFAAIREHFALHDRHIFLHSFVGGAIDPRWTTRWLSPENPQPKTTTAELMTQKLRQFLEQRLPNYMIPTIYMPLEALPLTPNGKIDRRALPQPILQSHQSDLPSVPPTTELENAIANLWELVLQVEVPNIYNSFFELGGNSLSATQVISQMRSSLQLDLPIREFFLNPTLAAQADLLKQQWGEKQWEEKRQKPDESLEIERLHRGDAVELLSNIDQLSEDDVDALLQQMLALEESELS